MWETIPQPDRTIYQPADTATGMIKTIPQPAEPSTSQQIQQQVCGKPSHNQTEPYTSQCRYSNRYVENHSTTRQNHKPASRYSSRNYPTARQNNLVAIR
jgi:hypothetical protein